MKKLILVKKQNSFRWNWWNRHNWSCSNNEQHGFRIQGSDLTKNKNTISCSKSGIKIFIGHSTNNIKKATILVKSCNKKNNTELKFAKRKIKFQFTLGLKF